MISCLIDILAKSNEAPTLATETVLKTNLVHPLIAVGYDYSGIRCSGCSLLHFFDRIPHSVNQIYTKSEPGAQGGDECFCYTVLKSKR